MNAVVRALGIGTRLRAWTALLPVPLDPAGRPAGGPAPRTLAEAEEEIGRLRAEVVRLREREIVLKKSLGILSETPGSGMPGSRR